MRLSLRKKCFSLGIALFGLAAAANAQMPLAPSAAPNLTQIGVAAAVQGRVEITTPGAVGRIVHSGEAVYLGDTIKTDGVGTLQILLLDETVFTIGPNSSMVVDEFVYDPANDAGKVTAHITQGFFRFVTGKIAKKDPEKMKVNLPAGTIGIRGTMVAGRVEGQRSFVALLGPGPQNSAGSAPGSITVSNSVGVDTRSVSISRPGFGTTIEGVNQPPAPPVHIPQPELDALTGVFGQGPQPVGPNAPGEPGQPQTPAASGQPAPPQQAPGQPAPTNQQEGGAPQGPPGPMGPPPPGGGFNTGMGPMGMPPMGPPLGPFQPPISPPPLPPLNQAAQDAANQTQQVANGLAKLDQLRSIQTGIFHFHVNHPLRFHQLTPVDRVGLMEANIDINFGARTIGGGNSKVLVRTIGASCIDQTINIASQSFATGNQDAVFSQTTSSLTATIEIRNADGAIGNRMRLRTDYDNNAVGATGTGISDDVPRQSGSSPP